MIAVTKNNDIVVIKDDNPQVFVCDNTGKLKHMFERGSRYLRDLGLFYTSNFGRVECNSNNR
jgi:hypothetical protein